MSDISAWTYVTRATVRPRLGMDLETQSVQYGAEYTILCDWIAMAEQVRGDDGAEFIGRHTVYTEDPRPQYLDMIRLPGLDKFEEIRSRTMWNMAAFGQKADFKLVT